MFIERTKKAIYQDSYLWPVSAITLLKNSTAISIEKGVKIHYEQYYEG